MITGVALKNKASGYVVSLPKPNRHNHVIKKIVDEHDVDKVIGTEWVQGFVTDQGNFLDRKAAAAHAFRHRQIEDHDNDCLFSEDLW